MSAVLGDIKSKIASLSTAIGAVKDTEARTKLQAAQAELAAAESAFTKAVQQYANKAAEMQQLKLDYRKKMSEMGAAADKATGGADGEKFEVLAKLLGESDTFLAQVSATIALAEARTRRAPPRPTPRPRSSGRRRRGAGGPALLRSLPAAHPGQVHAQLRRRAEDPVPASGHRRRLRIGRGRPHEPEGGVEAVNPVLKVAIGVLKGYETDVKAYAEELRGAFSTEAQ